MQRSPEGIFDRKDVCFAISSKSRKPSPICLEHFMSEWIGLGSLLENDEGTANRTVWPPSQTLSLLTRRGVILRLAIVQMPTLPGLAVFSGEAIELMVLEKVSKYLTFGKIQEKKEKEPELEPELKNQM